MGRSPPAVFERARRRFKRVKRAVRGRPARTPEDAIIQRKVVEQLLHENGLSPADIHGVDRDTVTVRKRHDVAATLRRACAACGRRRLTGGLSVAFVATSVVGVHTASYPAGILGAAVAFAAYATATAPEWVFDEPGPGWAVSNTQGGGLTDREVMERLAIIRERREYEQELIDDEVESSKRKNENTFQF